MDENESQHLSILCDTLQITCVLKQGYHLFNLSANAYIHGNVRNFELGNFQAELDNFSKQLDKKSHKLYLKLDQFGPNLINFMRC